MNGRKLVAVPQAVITVSGPLTAPPGITATICLGDITDAAAASTPAKRTAATSPKPVPVIVTVDPADPDVGSKLVITGSTTKKLVAATIPAALVRLIESVVASSGTTVISWVVVTAV